LSFFATKQDDNGKQPTAAKLIANLMVLGGVAG